MKLISRIQKCLSRKQNIVKVALCSLVILVVLVLAIRLFFSLLNASRMREGYKGASELLLLHMRGCPHCVKLIPEWEVFVSKNNTGIKTKSVERSEDPALVKKHNVTGFPTILLLDSQGNKIKDYKGPRTANGLLDFCKRNS